MDARQQLWAAGRIDTLINTARNRQRFSPPQTSWLGELGVAEKGERLTSTLRTHSMNN